MTLNQRCPKYNIIPPQRALSGVLTHGLIAKVHHWIDTGTSKTLTQSFENFYICNNGLPLILHVVLKTCYWIPNKRLCLCEKCDCLSSGMGRGQITIIIIVRATFVSRAACPPDCLSILFRGHSNLVTRFLLNAIYRLLSSTFDQVLTWILYNDR